jgi:hypothetical protein
MQNQSIELIKDYLMQLEELKQEAVNSKDFFMSACYKAKIEGIKFCLKIIENGN